MDRIIPLHNDPHQEMEKLLPWYVTGQLDAVDRAAVEAHLGACAACQAELRTERRLNAEIANLPSDAASGWAEFRDRLDRSPARASRSVRTRTPGWRKLVPSANIGWLIAAQAALLVIAVSVALPRGGPVAYHALGTPAAHPTGNVIVIFRPDTSERIMRRTLNQNGARLVDGPTAADAYVLEVPAAGRAAALARLRAQSEIVLAEPIDAGPPS